MKCKMRFLVAMLAASACAYGHATQPVTILSYDVADSLRSGWGCWKHQYNGTITNTGRIVSSAVVCLPDGNQVANYSGGGGTLTDGMIASTADNIHLFTTRLADDGLPITPVITLHLGAKYRIKEIRVFGGDVEFNIIPGALAGATIEIDGIPQALEAIGFGSPNALGIQANDKFDLRDGPLENLVTDKVVLRDFSASYFGFPLDQFSITEIQIDGEPGARQVAIDIAPDNEVNRVTPGAPQLVPVAIMSASDFGARTSVDQASLRFGRTGEERSLAFCQSSPRDVNSDGLADLVCFFNASKMGFAAGDMVGKLKGRTVSGEDIEGEDRVCIGTGPCLGNGGAR